VSRPNESGRQQPVITMHFSALDRVYEPLEPVRIRYTVELPGGGLRVRAIERSLLWYTEGKGEEDIGVHFFERISDRKGMVDAAAEGSFESLLPRSPLSYEGLIVKIRWCARVRLFFEDGRDFVSEHVFDVGRIPAIVLPS